MSTITVENTNYQFEEIPGKGKCLVPVKLEPDTWEKASRVSSVGDFNKKYTLTTIYNWEAIIIKDFINNKYNIMFTNTCAINETWECIDWHDNLVSLLVTLRNKKWNIGCKS
jgi:hypothetical protein